MARLLLVDDERMLLDGILQLLRASGYEVEGASSGEEALDHFNKDQLGFDLIICDIRMNGMTGLEFWDQLWRLLGENMIPFLFISAKANDSDLALIEKTQRTFFLRKPFEIPALLESIQNLLDMR